MSAKPLQFSEQDVMWADMVCAQKRVEEIIKRVGISRATHFRRLNDERPKYRQYRELLNSRRSMLLQLVKPESKIGVENLLDLRLDILNKENMRREVAEAVDARAAIVLREQIFDMAGEVAKHAGVYGIQLGGDAAKPILVPQETPVTFEEQEAMEERQRQALPAEVRDRHAST